MISNAINNGLGWIDYSDLAHAITIPTPCYRMNGDLWHEDEVPSGGSVAYHLSLSDATINSRCFPVHARSACLAYRETLRALLSAGF